LLCHGFNPRPASMPGEPLQRQSTASKHILPGFARTRRALGGFA
jgi:hypothetical protein